MKKIMNGKLFEYTADCSTPACVDNAKKRLKSEGYLYVRSIKKSDRRGNTYWEIWKSNDTPRSKRY